MIRQVRSLYLRDEQRFDRWGALGKVLATLEAFRLEGVRLDPGKLHAYVNLAFPRTFSCQRTPAPGEHLPSREVIRAERDSLVELLTESGVPGERVGSVALEELGERRCLDPGFIREYLKCPK